MADKENKNIESNEENNNLKKILLYVLACVAVFVIGIGCGVLLFKKGETKDSSKETKSKVEATTKETSETKEGETTETKEGETVETKEGETDKETSEEQTFEEDETVSVDKSLYGNTAKQEFTDDEKESAKAAIVDYYNMKTVDDYLNGIPEEFRSAMVKAYGITDDTLKEYMQDTLDDLDKQYMDDYSCKLSDCRYEVELEYSTTIDSESVNETTGQMRSEWKDPDLKDLTGLMSFKCKYSLYDSSDKEVDSYKEDDYTNTVYCYDGKWYSIDALYMVDYAASTQIVSNDDGTLDLTQ